MIARLLPWLSVVALACDSRDADFDGFAATEDCDDADPFIYPGAPEVAADGVDDDCDGEDQGFAFLGRWTLTSIDVSYAGLRFVLPDQSDGFLRLDDDGAARLELNVVLDPVIASLPVPISIALAGGFAPALGEDLFSVYAEGFNREEWMHAAWDCGLRDEVVACDGEVKALDLSLRAISTFSK